MGIVTEPVPSVRQLVALAGEGFPVEYDTGCAGINQSSNSLRPTGFDDIPGAGDIGLEVTLPGAPDARLGRNVKDRVHTGNSIVDRPAVREIAATHIHAFGLKHRLRGPAKTPDRIAAPKQQIDHIATHKTAASCHQNLHPG